MPTAGTPPWRWRPPRTSSPAGTIKLRRHGLDTVRNGSPMRWPASRPKVRPADDPAHRLRRTGPGGGRRDSPERLDHMSASPACRPSGTTRLRRFPTACAARSAKRAASTTEDLWCSTAIAAAAACWTGCWRKKGRADRRPHCYAFFSRRRRLSRRSRRRTRPVSTSPTIWRATSTA